MIVPAPVGNSVTASSDLYMYVRHDIIMSVERGLL